jgi:hypothetical protein
MNIWVPDDLKRRMDKVKKAGVNWSQVASRAFEVKLGEIAAQKEKKAMSDVVVDGQKWKQFEPGDIVVTLEFRAPPLKPPK